MPAKWGRAGPCARPDQIHAPLALSAGCPRTEHRAGRGNLAGHKPKYQGRMAEKALHVDDPQFVNRESPQAPC
jgi:hypothetical protein